MGFDYAKNVFTDSVFLYTTECWHGFEYVFYHNCNKASLSSAHLPSAKMNTAKYFLFTRNVKNVKHALVTSLLISLLNFLFRLKFDCTSNDYSHYL